LLKKKEIFIQDAVSKCGACSIASIISHYNGYVPLETIIDDTFTDKNGTNAYQIVQTLQKYGFISYGMKTSLSKINIFPVIAHVLKNGLEHFLVIYDIKKGHVITMDPECGEKQYLIEEFEKYFSGNVIFCNPTNNIIKYEKNKKFQKEIKCGIKKQKKLVLLFIILSAILIFINIFYSFYLKIAEVNNNIFNITLLFIIILNIKFLMSYFINYIQIKIIINVDELLNNKFLNHIFAIKVLSLYNKRSGDIIKKIGDMNLVKDFIIKILLSFVSNAILFCLGVIILTIYNFQLGIVFLIMALLYVVISIVISKKLYKQNLENNLKHSNYMGILTESVNNIITIKNLNVTSHFKNKINFTYDEYLYSTRSLSRNINKINNTTSFIKEFTILIVNFIGIISINNGLGNIVDLFTFNTLIIVIYDALENLVSFYPEYLRFKAVFRASSEFLDIKHENISEETLETFECFDFR